MFWCARLDIQLRGVALSHCPGGSLIEGLVLAVRCGVWESLQPPICMNFVEAPAPGAFGSWTAEPKTRNDSAAGSSSSTGRSASCEGIGAVQEPGVVLVRAGDQAAGRSASRRRAGRGRHRWIARVWRSPVIFASVPTPRDPTRARREDLDLLVRGSRVSPLSSRPLRITVRPLGSRSLGRVPAALRHVGLARPGLAERVEREDRVEALELYVGADRLYYRLPPATTTRPSIRNDVPEHQMLAGFITPSRGSSQSGGSTRLV